MVLAVQHGLECWQIPFLRSSEQMTEAVNACFARAKPHHLTCISHSLALASCVSTVEALLSFRIVHHPVHPCLKPVGLTARGHKLPSTTLGVCSRPWYVPCHHPALLSCVSCNSHAGSRVERSPHGWLKYHKDTARRCWTVDHLYLGALCVSVSTGGGFVDPGLHPAKGVLHVPGPRGQRYWKSIHHCQGVYVCVGNGREHVFGGEGGRVAHASAYEMHQRMFVCMRVSACFVEVLQVGQCPADALRQISWIVLLGAFCMDYEILHHINAQSATWGLLNGPAAAVLSWLLFTSAPKKRIASTEAASTAATIRSTHSNDKFKGVHPGIRAAIVVLPILSAKYAADTFAIQFASIFQMLITVHYKLPPKTKKPRERKAAAHMAIG
eukprot:1139713-Pelagomonas_calceolata.AAC.1